MDTLGLSGSAIKEEKQLHKGGVQTRKKDPQHVINVRGLLDAAIKDASGDINNVQCNPLTFLSTLAIILFFFSLGGASAKTNSWIGWLQ